MKSGEVTYRISPALFAEYCYFSTFRCKNYRLLRTLCLVALAAAGVICAVYGFAYGKTEITVLGGIIVLVSVMLSFVQKKYIKSRYRLVYGGNMVTYTASFTKNGTFIISAGEITEKYAKSEIVKIYRFFGGFAVKTANGGDFLVPAVDVLPDIEWFKNIYGAKLKICA